MSLDLEKEIITQIFMTNGRIFCIWGSVYGLCAVVLGAFGAHALDARLEALGTREVWNTAVDYQMWHALALLIIGFYSVRSRSIQIAAAAFCVGILLFSGSLYWLALDGPRWLGPITPLGGLSLMIGWGALIVSTIRVSEG